MGTYPTSPREDFLAWCQAHIQIFIDNAIDIGLTPSQAQAFRSATEMAAGVLANQELQRQALRTATQHTTDSFETLRGSAAEMVRSIRTFAENNDDPNVYIIAQIPPPADPSTAPPPAKPVDLRVELEPGTGAITLRWKANNPRGTSGTSYIIRRRLTSQGDFAFVGVTGSKKFTDLSFVAGPDSVQYTVQGQRADRAGLVSDIFTITFGRQGPGLADVSVLDVSATTNPNASSGTPSARLAA